MAGAPPAGGAEGGSHGAGQTLARVVTTMQNSNEKTMI